MRKGWFLLELVIVLALVMTIILVMHQQLSALKTQINTIDQNQLQLESHCFTQLRDPE